MGNCDALSWQDTQTIITARKINQFSENVFILVISSYLKVNKYSLYTTYNVIVLTLFSYFWSNFITYLSEFGAHDYFKLQLHLKISQKNTFRAKYRPPLTLTLLHYKGGALAIPTGKKKRSSWPPKMEGRAESEWTGLAQFPLVY